ncbi:MAG: hypothetical protein QG588_1590 [Candidatus Poribacteria bacterium]|nr:hypothetical protein [Candidatus Poribacteria bacterium]
MSNILTDDQLVNKTLEGNIDAFGILVDKYRGLVHGLAFHIVGNFQDAEDIAQDTFIKAYENLTDLKDKLKFGNWLKIITLNTCKMWLRRSTLELPSHSKNDIDEYIPPDYEIQEIVYKALSALSSKNQIVIALFYLDDLSYKEISDFLGLPVSTVQSRIQRARQQLKEEVLKMAEDILQNNRLGSKFAQKVLDEIMAEGWKHIEDNEWNKAESIFLKAIEMKPDHAEAYYHVGYAKENLGQYSEAVEWYQKAVEIKPDYARAYYNLAISLGGIGKREEAIKAYDKVIEISKKLLELSPDDAELYEQIGEAYEGKNDLDNAISTLKQAIALKPDYAEAYAYLGHIYYRKGDMTKAKNMYEKAIEIGKNSGRVHGGFGANGVIMAYNNLGSIYNEEGDHKQAVFYLRMAVEKSKELGETGDMLLANLTVAIADRASSFAGIGDYDKAVNDYKRVIKTYDTTIGKILGHGKPETYIRWQFEKGKDPNVIKAFESFIAQNPEDAEAYYCLACLYFIDGEDAKSLEMLNKAIAIDSVYEERAKSSSFFIK